MEYSSDLTDKEWEMIEPLLPQKKKTRPPVWTKRQLLNGIFYQLKYHLMIFSIILLLIQSGCLLHISNSTSAIAQNFVS
ncbi:transposase [Chamaesiphon sp.]|uniref:transposase n=1 Tax=Chamaesiphon sp. TaxID=2814140 RepID=UPI0035931F3A